MAWIGNNAVLLNSNLAHVACMVQSDKNRTTNAVHHTMSAASQFLRLHLFGI